MNKLIGLLIIIIFSIGCDTLLQDRDVSPTLALIPQSQTEDEYVFSFEMYAVEQINSFACEILFDSEVFDIYTESFVDDNNNGGYEYDEEYFDCGIDQLCNTDEEGYDFENNPDPNLDDYNQENNPYNSEGNGKFDDVTIIFDAIFASIPHFGYISKSENGKLSILGGLVELQEGLPLVFEAIDQKIATIRLKIKENIEIPSQSMISIGNWQLLQEDGNGAYFGGMVVTDTLYVNF